MDSVLVGTLGLILFLLLLALGVHISINFFIVGFLSMMILLGLKPVLVLMAQTMYYSIASPSFAALPLYILMGAFAAKSGLAGKPTNVYIFLHQNYPEH